jgi:beta-galactosidase
MKKLIFISCLFVCTNSFAQNVARQIENFGKGWKFILDSIHDNSTATVNDASWRTLNLPHDWSIEMPFDKNSPTGTSGGALRGGMGWYRKTFSLPASSKNKNVFIDFDGVYMNSEVWINGHSLGVHPYGYTSFRYNLTPYLDFDKPNVITVKVDNSKQPNSRWYSGSGIYRNVWLVTTGAVYVDHWGTYVTTTNITDQSATINVNTVIRRTGSLDKVLFSTIIYDANNNPVARKMNTPIELNDSITNVSQQIILSKPDKVVIKASVPV